MHLAHRRLPALPVLLFVAAAARPVEAQEVRAEVPRSAYSTLEITVHAADGDRPLSGARVWVEGIGMRRVTDRDGFVRIESLPPGQRRVQVEYLGFAPLDEIVAFEPGRPTRIVARLNVQAIALAGVRVRARPSVLLSRGFFDRRRFGNGTFFTREDIEAMRPRYLSDVLRRVGGISVGTAAFGARPPAQIRGPSSIVRSCPIQFYIDGTLTAGFNIDDVTPGDVEGIEIYKGAATIPAVFNKGTAMCGVIVIWTRID